MTWIGPGLRATMVALSLLASRLHRERVGGPETSTVKAYSSETVHLDGTFTLETA